MRIEKIDVEDYEAVYKAHLEVSPEKENIAIIAIYDTSLGPALGGTRLWNYDTEEDALEDVKRLAKGMAYKAAAADLPLGGGKAVIMADPEEKGEELFDEYGKAVDELDGKYITAEDVNTVTKDMAIVSRHTDHVVGLEEGLGDPSPITAKGVYHGIIASLKEHEDYDADNLEGLTVLIQGLGKVGQTLAEMLLEDGANVKGSDVDEEALEMMVEKGVEPVDIEDVYSEECDVFAPCALGGVINDETIDELKADIIAGAANNQLERREHAEELKEKGILYAPDYVINAGGLLAVYNELQGNTLEKAKKDAEKIENRLFQMFEEAKEKDITPLKAADIYAERRMEEAE